MTTNYNAFFSIPCSICEAVHTPGADSYISFSGNIYVGIDRKLGDNFNSRNELVAVTAICRAKGCFDKFAKLLLPTLAKGKAATK